MPHYHDEYVSWPPQGGIRGVLAGMVTINLNDSRVTLPGDQSVEGLGRSSSASFHSIVIYQDQPGLLGIDSPDVNPINLRAGVNIIERVNIDQILYIDSYMPRDMHIMLFHEPEPKIRPTNEDYVFLRTASTASQESSFAAVDLRPVDLINSKHQNAAGTPGVARVFPNAFNGIEESGPEVAMLGQKTMTIKNTGSTGQAIVKLQGKKWHDRSFHDLDNITGPDGILVEPGENAVLEIGSDYLKIRIFKRTIGTPSILYAFMGRYRVS